jgi:hypothetical protein
MPTVQSQHFTGHVNSTCKAPEVKVPAPHFFSVKLKGIDKTMRNINPFYIQKALGGIILKVKIKEWYTIW